MYTQSFNVPDGQDADARVGIKAVARSPTQAEQALQTR